MNVRRGHGQQKRNDTERNRNKSESATTRIATKCGTRKSDRKQRTRYLNNKCNVEQSPL
jgi:hypothetical protein